MCNFYSCYEKAKIKTSDNQGNSISYHSRCQKHLDQMKAYNNALRKDRKARVSSNGGGGGGGGGGGETMSLDSKLRRKSMYEAHKASVSRRRCIYIYI